MSKFLAPIHSWLFNKIQIHEGLEKEIQTSLTEKYGEDVTSIVDANAKEYGQRLASDNIEDIIDESNIHGWLQQSITVAETRQAAIIGDLVAKFGDEAKNLIEEVYKSNAIAHAKSAKEAISAQSPEDVYKVINNYVLDGMPCDSAGSVTESTQDLLEAVQNSCLHIAYWEKAGVDPDLMYSLRTEWTKAFVNELNPQFIYNAKIEKSASGSRNFTYTIKRK